VSFKFRWDFDYGYVADDVERSRQNCDQMFRKYVLEDFLQIFLPFPFLKNTHAKLNIKKLLFESGGFLVDWLPKKRHKDVASVFSDHQLLVAQPESIG